MNKSSTRLCVALLMMAGAASAQVQMEPLGRGVVAIQEGTGKVFVSWRLLGTDPTGIAFNVYRALENKDPVRLNEHPLAGSNAFH